MPKLFKNEESDSEGELNINKDYAINYDNWRQKEELHKLKARYGEDVELLGNSEGSSESSSEDDEGTELTEEFEKNFYKTLAYLKNKDPTKYNENVKFFEESEKNNVENGTQSKKKKEKSLFLRDYERKLIVERGGKLSDSEDEDAENQNKSHNPTYVQEQKELKHSFKKVLQDEDEEEDLLKPKSKSKEEKQKEEEEYKEWLKGQQKEINEEDQKELKPLRDFWTDPNLDKNEKFLRDYILNKKFLFKESEDADLEYDHIAHNSDENLSEDEKDISQQEEFEHKYNFRFEEPDQEFIKRYPRTLENSVRKKDTRRAEKRAEVKQRKEQEKLKKQEELKQLKALKRKEIEEKIEKLKEITGNDDLEFNMMDLEGDFDPDEYDKKMSKIFNDEYYSENKDEMKPEFPDIDEELAVESTWDNYDPTSDVIAQEDVPYYDGPHCEDPEFNMDADCDGQQNLESELIESTKQKKRRRRSKFAEMISQEKPKFDPTKHKSYQEYYDQYYALDYEDMIGDLPCRFKYRQVVPNDYGLTIEEILMADDKELNKWCSLKRALQHKPDYKELNDVKMYKQKAANEALKKKILKSLYTMPEEEKNEAPIASTSQNSEQGAKKKRKRKRKTQNNENEEAQQSEQSKQKVEESSNNEENMKKSQKNKKKGESISESNGKDKEQTSGMKNLLTVETEQINNKKRKLEQSVKEVNEAERMQKKKKKKKSHQNSESQSNVPSEVTVSSDSRASSMDHIKTEVEKSSVDNGSKQNKVKSNKEKKNNRNKDMKTLSKKEKRKLEFKKKLKNKQKTEEVDQINSLSSERLKAYGLNPKKFKNKLKYKKKH